MKLNADQVVPFLKSVIASDEPLSAEDVDAIEAALAARAAQDVAREEGRIDVKAGLELYGCRDAKPPIECESWRAAQDVAGREDYAHHDFKQGGYLSDPTPADTCVWRVDHGPYCGATRVEHEDVLAGRRGGTWRWEPVTPPPDAPTANDALRDVERERWAETYAARVIETLPTFATPPPDALREALELIAAAPTDAPDSIGVTARNIATAALRAQGVVQSPVPAPTLPALDARLALARLERFIDFDPVPMYVTANGIRQDMPKRLHSDANALREALRDAV